LGFIYVKELEINKINLINFVQIYKIVIPIINKTIITSISKK